MDGTSKGSLCSRCRRTLSSPLTFAIRTPSGESVRCLRCALRHAPILKRSLKACLVVGSLLVLLNQGDHLFSAHWSPALSWKIPLTYLVPFLVATWGALSNARQERWRRQACLLLQSGDGHPPATLAGGGRVVADHQRVA